MVTDVWHLETVDWLRELSEPEIARLRARSVANDYPRGAAIFTPQTQPHSLYLVETGRVRIYRLSRAGDEITFGYVTSGEVFGELTVFGDFPRESFAMAVDPSRVWKVPREPFQELLSTRPALTLAITRQIGQRMKRIENRVENLVFRDARSRVAGILLELAEDFGTKLGDELTLDLELTQTELATLVGSTRQTVNVSLGELERSGHLTREGGSLVILKAAALAHLAASPPDGERSSR